MRVRTPRTRWLVLLAIVVAWAAGFVARAAWLSEKGKTATSMFEGHRLLTTADAYFYATGVQHAVEGGVEHNGRVPTINNSIVVLIGEAAVELFGAPVEDVCTWMPAFLAPLVAVPLVLLGLLYGHLVWGFLAALVSVLGLSYWNRTVPGYFDTDMVTIPYVIGVIVLLMTAFWRRRSWVGAIAGALTGPRRTSIRARSACSPPSPSASSATPWCSIARSRTPSASRSRSSSPSCRCRSGRDSSSSAPSRRCSHACASRRGRSPVAAGLLLAFVCWRNQAMDLVLNVVGLHIPRGGGAGIHGFSATEVQFPGIGETVSELIDPTLAKLGERVAGHSALMVLGSLGFLAAAWRYRPLLFFAPLIALGTVLAASGQRYTIFAVPVVALGNVWLMLLVGRAVAHFFRERKRLVEVVTAAALSPLAIWPAVAHAVNYPPRTALATQDAELLTQLKPHVKPGDFVISWWDYSYSMWFFTGAMTVVDGTKQNEDLWIASEVFFTPSQREAASLMRWAAEFQATRPPLDAVIDDMINDFTTRTQRPASELVPALRAGTFALPPKTREVYFYVPWRILQIAPNVAKLRPAKGLLPADEIGSGTFLRDRAAARRRQAARATELGLRRGQEAARRRARGARGIRDGGRRHRRERSPARARDGRPARRQDRRRHAAPRRPPPLHGPGDLQLGPVAAPVPRPTRSGAVRASQLQARRRSLPTQDMIGQQRGRRSTTAVRGLRTPFDSRGSAACRRRCAPRRRRPGGSAGCTSR